MKRTFCKTLSVVLSVLMLCTMFSSLLCTPASATLYKGDLNKNGKVDTSDARILLMTMANLTTLTTAQKAVADIDGDNVYTSKDVRYMLGAAHNDAHFQKSTRAFWVPYMEVADMLSSGNVTTAKNAIKNCLVDCYNRGTNVVYFHVRANSDAYYNSSVFPHHSYAATLINKGFDPLSYAIEVAHEYGMELHAWVNPYRIGTKVANAQLSSAYYFSYAKNGGTTQYYYIPSKYTVRQLVLSGVRELVNNYDIDGVQYDDYFYPEGCANDSAPSSFEKSDYENYVNGGGTLGLGDWRRWHVNLLIEQTYDICHEKEGIIFGVSPSCSFDRNYNEMYADAKAWAAGGYVDYIAPQLYIGFLNTGSPFKTVADEWINMPRKSSVKMIAGLGSYKTGLYDDTYAGSGRYEWQYYDDIMPRQVEYAKDTGWDGIAFYSHWDIVHFDTSTRNEPIATKDTDAGCEAWLIFK